MLFESRQNTAEVSEAWIPVRDAYLAGHAREAWQQATALRAPGALRIANDAILNIEIARACSAHRTYLALTRMALRAFPDDPIVQFYYMRMLLTRGWYMVGIEFLLERQSTLGQTHPALWATELANLYSNAGFERSCLQWLERARQQPGVDEPLALYAQAGACEGLKKWDAAIELAAQCVQAAPDWTRARVYLANCLLARGRLDEAQAELAEAQRRGHEEAMVEMVQAMLAMALGRFEDARTQLEGMLARWPQADFVKYVQRTLCILLVELGDHEAARRLADGQEDSFGLPPIPEATAGRHCFIPLPLIAQNKDQCVPTSAAMAAYPQGHRYDPDTLFREMHGREGTPLWRLRRWVEEHGLRLVPVRLEQEAITSMLDAGVPLIGTLQGPFNNHVEVVCGYNDNLRTLYVRDPGHWVPMAWPWDLALKRYALDDGLLAVIDAQRTDVIALAEQWKSTTCQAVLDLTQAVAQGERELAEAAYAAIPDSSPAASIRDGHALHVAISPVTFRERMQQILEDEDADFLSRFRALMCLPSQDTQATLERLLAEDNSQELAWIFRRFLKLQQLMAEGRWAEALPLTERLLLRGAGVAQFWEARSDVLAELGEHQASREALDKAIELEPLRMSLREKALNRSAGQLKFAEYLAEFDALLADDPDDRRLLWGRAEALRDGPDGRKFQEATLEALHWFPRAPQLYSMLLDWYQLQGRQDLFAALLDQASTLLPDIFQKQPDGPAAEEPQAQTETAQQAETNGHPAEALPEDKTELLELVWRLSDARRSAAVRQAVALDQQGQLHWYESARLLSCRLLVADEPDGQPNDPHALLPEHPPGAAHWYAQLVCDTLTEFEPNFRTALAVVEWTDRMVGDVTRYPELWFLRVLLLEHGNQVERALDELRQLLEKYPATASALYRMGVVKHRQEDLHSARAYLEQALEVNPGLLGAMSLLQTIHQALQNPQEEIGAVRMLRRKLPYAWDPLRDEFFLTADLDTHTAAFDLLDWVVDDFAPRRLDVLRARLHAVAGDLDQATAVLDRLELADDEQDEDLLSDAMQLRVALAEHSGDRDAVLALCERGLARWPESTRLKEIQAEYLATTDIQRSRQLLREVLCEGEPQAQTVYQYLSMSDQPPHLAAQEIVSQSHEDRRIGLSEMFCDALVNPNFLRSNEQFLLWANQQFPEADVFRWRLANHYLDTRQTPKAVQWARDLLDRNPDNPEAVRTLGRALVNHDNQEALQLLQRVCEDNRSVDFLTDLALCYQALQRLRDAEQLHWEILEQNPFMAPSWTNLYLLAAPKDRLWGYVDPMINQGRGVKDEYFLVATVLMALELNQRVPLYWFPLAAQRHEILQVQPGYRDERSRLTHALMAWMAHRPMDTNGWNGLPQGFLRGLSARYWWPRGKWIPANA